MIAQGPEPAVLLRAASAADAPALDRLAQLDSRPLPPGPHLIAERAGSVDAAISLRTGELVADPFVRTAELCELLRVRVRSVRHGHPATPSFGRRGRPLAVPA